MEDMAKDSRNTTPERKAYMKAYAEANRERIREHKKKYVSSDPERTRAQKRAWKQANPEKTKAHYEANKESILSKNKAYYEANKEEIRSQQKAYREANKSKLYLRVQAGRYGLSRDELIGMAHSQDDACLICKTPFTLAKMNVDHCHKTGAVRGLLCGECNRGLSCFKDNLKSMRSAIKYLAEFAKRSA